MHARAKISQRNPRPQTTTQPHTHILYSLIDNSRLLASAGDRSGESNSIHAAEFTPEGGGGGGLGCGRGGAKRAGAAGCFVICVVE